MSCSAITTTLTDCWQRVLQMHGSECAVLDFASDTSHTFRQIDAMAEALVGQLRQQEIGAGDTVLLCESSGSAWLAAYLALTRCGAAIAPVEPENSAELTARKCRALATALNAAALLDASGLHCGCEPFAAPARQPAQQQAGSVSADNSLERLHGTAVCGLPDCTSMPTPGSRLRAAATHLYKLTSGSTGQPQALAFTEAGMVADGRSIVITMGLHGGSINYAAIPLGHSYGLGNLVMPFFLQGTPIAFASSILPRVMAQEIDACGATFLPTVPTVARALCAADLPAGSLGSLQTVISAGSVLSPQVAQDFYRAFRKPIQNFYGSSETGGICFDSSGEATLSGRSVGSPMHGVRLSLDENSRVRVLSDAVCPALNPDGLGVLLGDEGELLPGGELCLRGRSGQMIKIGARRLNLSQWETQVRAIDGIEDAFAGSSERSGGETMLCAALQSALPADAVRQLLREHLPTWQIPRRLIVLPAFPMTARGKRDSARLKDLLQIS